MKLIAPTSGEVFFSNNERKISTVNWQEKKQKWTIIMVKMPLLIKHMSNSLNVNSNNATSANAAVTEKPPAFGLRHKDR